jgi:hypothetical protein
LDRPHRRRGKHQRECRIVRAQAVHYAREVRPLALLAIRLPSENALENLARE